MNVELVVHAWYHPAGKTFSYIIGLQKALNTVNIYSYIVNGYNFPYNAFFQYLITPFFRYILPYKRDPSADILHDTTGDSVFKGVDVSTILDLYWYTEPEDLIDKIIRIPMRFYANYKRTLKLSKQIIVVSEFTLNEIKRVFGINYLEKVNVIPPPIEYKPFNKNMQRENDILWIGSTVKRKRLVLFLNSLNKLNENYNVIIKISDANKLISYDHQLIKQEVHRLRQKGHNIIIINGSVSQSFLDQLYFSSKCIVSTSSYEGFHMPIAEAYLHGVNVVVPYNEIYYSIYRNAEGVHYYKDLNELPHKITEAINYGRFNVDTNIINYLSFSNVGKLLKSTYEKALSH